MKTPAHGFTIIEFLVLITITVVLLAFTFSGCGLPNYLKAKDKAKEAETKAKLHTIQIALERYATDHSGSYPKQIYGGDTWGWSTDMGDEQPVGCMAVGIPHAEDPANSPPQDPLVLFSYIYSYPTNSFIEPGKGVTTTITWTGGCEDPGYGDPRFGYNGEIMGNCLNDPRYLWERKPFEGPIKLSNEQYMIYDWEGTRENNIAMIHPDSPVNPFYSMGGLPKGGGRKFKGISGKSGTMLKTYWPGQFFYRSAGDFFFVSTDSSATTPYKYIWDMPYQRVNRYMLGAYGSFRTAGKDVIRLTDKDGYVANNTEGYLPDVYETYEDFLDNSFKPIWEVALSTPEVFGGGTMGTLPTFPYWGSPNREWIYGAEDGYKDGVILVLVSGNP